MGSAANNSTGCRPLQSKQLPGDSQACTESRLSRPTVRIELESLFWRRNHPAVLRTQTREACLSSDVSMQEKPEGEQQRVFVLKAIMGPVGRMCCQRLHPLLPSSYHCSSQNIVNLGQFWKVPVLGLILAMLTSWALLGSAHLLNTWTISAPLRIGMCLRICSEAGTLASEANHSQVLLFRTCGFCSHLGSVSPNCRGFNAQCQADVEGCI